MSLAAAPPAHAMVLRLPDRSQGDTGIALRERVDEALAPRDWEERGQNIYRRISAALHRALRDEGRQTSPEAVSRALELLMALPTTIPLPDVVVESESEIGLDWDEGRRRVLSLTVRGNPLVGYSALLGAEPVYGRVAFFGDLPPTLRSILSRLYFERAYR